MKSIYGEAEKSGHYQAILDNAFQRLMDEQKPKYKNQKLWDAVRRRGGNYLTLAAEGVSEDARRARRRRTTN